MRGEVHNPQQAPPQGWKVDVPEQNTAASSDGGSALQRLGVPAQLAARLEDWHTQSFVAVEGLCERHEARRPACRHHFQCGDACSTRHVCERTSDKPARLTRRRHHCLCHSQLLLQEVDSTLVAMRTALARFGLHLNMGRGKTELMLMLRRRGTQEARRSLTHDQGGYVSRSQ